MAVAYKQAVKGHRSKTVFFHALLFVLGFSVVFVIGWGGIATLAGDLFRFYRPYIAKLGGLVIILFGLVNLGVIRIRWLMADTRPLWQGRPQQKGWVSSGLMGVFFAAGWSPCIGTTLAAILTMAVSQETRGMAIILSGVYALGLGLPFLLIGYSIERAASTVARFRSSLPVIQKISGILLIVLGLLLITDRFIFISAWTQRTGWYLDFPLGAGAVPGVLIALTAGFVSFFSPCVLPLVPAYVGYLSGHATGESALASDSA